MKVTIKKAIALASAIAMAGTLAACGGSDTAGSTTLKFQTWNLKNEKFTSYFEDLIAKFEKENQGVTIKWVDQPADNYEDKLSTDAAAGELPDVVDMGPEAAYTLANGGILMDISKEAPDAKDDFLDAAWQAATFKGPDLEEGTYGFPWYLNTGPTYYNKALLEECGIGTDKTPKTQDDVFSMADTFGKNCGGKYALTSGIPSIQDFGMYGVQLMNKDRTEFTFNNKKGVDFVQHYIDMYNDKAFTDDMLNSSSSGESKSFNGGTQAFMNGSAFSVADIRQNAPKVYEHLGITNFVANTNPNMFMEMIVVNAATKNKDLALKFARYVTNSENQLSFDKKASVFPSSKGTIDDEFFNPKGDSMDDEAMRMSAEQVRNGRIWGPPQFTSAVTNYLREQIALALQGKLTAKEALDATVKYANERIK
ncbi:ABC transporter substrate-binding protein [Bifidobacterium adolescentis]|uniref:ABC transporter substrate-binding protein n=1 Tax=Bifidobacterium adolescentis TaxID=1680 RepID=UPI000E4D1EC2|nr:sugar ABC transporter substrate-binding protein [Bifidobacterium adolescentis]RGU87791.1 sugar ABC transporter substrate-binding protein [Bifidobacterium adolescentis]